MPETSGGTAEVPGLAKGHSSSQSWATRAAAIGSLYYTEFFEALDEFELDHLKVGGGRAPLVVHLRDRATGDEFLFVNNHFHRGNANKRDNQARGFREWASQQRCR
jgi:hypothetical protein